MGQRIYTFIEAAQLLGVLLCCDLGHCRQSALDLSKFNLGGSTAHAQGNNEEQNDRDHPGSGRKLGLRRQPIPPPS